MNFFGVGLMRSLLRKLKLFPLIFKNFSSITIKNSLARKLVLNLNL